MYLGPTPDRNKSDTAGPSMSHTPLPSPSDPRALSIHKRMRFFCPKKEKYVHSSHRNSPISGQMTAHHVWSQTRQARRHAPLRKFRTSDRRYTKSRRSFCQCNRDCDHDGLGARERESERVCVRERERGERDNTQHTTHIPQHNTWLGVESMYSNTPSFGMVEV